MFRWNFFGHRVVPSLAAAVLCAGALSADSHLPDLAPEITGPHRQKLGTASVAKSESRSTIWEA